MENFDDENEVYRILSMMKDYSNESTIIHNKFKDLHLINEADSDAEYITELKAKCNNYLEDMTSLVKKFKDLGGLNE